MTANRTLWICSIAIVWGVSLADASPPFQPVPMGCGFVLTTLCTGCSPNNPGACGCGPHQGQCDCVDQTGNPQTANLVQCSLGPFAVLWSFDGNVVSLGAPDDCGTISACLGPQGAIKCDESAPCTSNACQWQVISTISASQFLEGSPCGRV